MNDLRYTPDAELAIEEVAAYSLALYGPKGEAYMQGLQIVIERLRLLPRMGLEVPPMTSAVRARAQFRLNRVRSDACDYLEQLAALARLA